MKETLMAVRLLLARHGETTWNADDRFMGQTDIGLSEAGERQAARLALRLAREPVGAAYASTLERAWRTAEIALAGRGLPVTRDSAWSEAAYGEWEGFSWKEVIDLDPALVARRRADLANVAPPGGETFLQLQGRLVEAVERLRQHHDGSTVLVVAHGGPLRVLAAWCMGLGPQEQGRFVIANAGLSAIELEQHGVVLEFWNNTAHLRDDVENTQRPQLVETAAVRQQ
jgi:2,3-bisphosphoglycerate-dependent phosphoglycerate mutase